MAEVTLEFLGEQAHPPVRGASRRQRAARSGRKRGRQTRHQGASGHRLAQPRAQISLGLDQQQDAVAELKCLVAALEARVKALEERPH
jgi:hypothetical protein